MDAAQSRPAAQQDRAVIDQAIRHHATTGLLFSANTIRPMLPVVSGSIIGARFLAASKSGQIEAIGSVMASHRRGHGRRLVLWRGTAPAHSHANGQTPGPTPSPTPERPRPVTDASARSDASSGPTSLETKAARLLTRGKVRVWQADTEGRIVAHVAGDTSRYTVRRSAAGRWVCNCHAASFGGACSHVAAVAMIAEARAAA